MNEGRFEEALGAYVGPASFEEIVRTLADHEGLWIALLQHPDNAVVWCKSGNSWGVQETDERIVFAIAGTEQHAGNPAIYIDAPLVLTFVKPLGLSAACSLYTGGLVIEQKFGDHQGDNAEAGRLARGLAHRRERRHGARLRPLHSRAAPFGR